MSCCGNSRNAARLAASGTTAARVEAAATQRAAVSAQNLWFEYLGEGAATIVGPKSGQRYRFAGRGDRVRIDPRDRPGLAAMPRLRMVV